MIRSRHSAAGHCFSNSLLEALASQSGGLLNIAELSNTCALARPSVERYLFLLEQPAVALGILQARLG